MNVLDLTVPSLAAFVVVLGILIAALSQISAGRELRRRMTDAEDRYRASEAEILDALDDGEGLDSVRTILAASDSRHPAIGVLRRMVETDPCVADDMALMTWIAISVRECMGAARTRMERLCSVAPPLGFSGTIVGFLIAAWVFSGNRDQAQLMQSVALALTSTLGAGIVAMILRWELESTLDPLETRLCLQTQDAAARFRNRAGLPGREHAERLGEVLP